MKRTAPLALLLIGTLFLAACRPKVNTSTATPTVAAAATTAAPTLTAAPTNTVAPSDTPVPIYIPPTNTTAPIATAAPSQTAAPAATDTQAPPATATTAPLATATTAPTAAATVTASPAATVVPAVYLDDRSNPTALMTSFASAINLHQYLRAYSYWRTGAAQLPAYPQYAAGYSTTQSVQVMLGVITGDAGAGQLYYSVPTKLVAQTTANTTQTFVGCYILHLSQPGIQGAPPFQGLAIDSAKVNQVANNANTAALLAQACSANPGGPLTVTPTPAANDISAARYLDDRTDAVQVLRSLFNAVNRKEYVRAYSYWEPNAIGLQPYSQFEAGYTNTAAVTLTVGTVTGDAGAGQRYWKVPVTLLSRTTAAITQTFVACYTLHLGLPDAQGVPPYQPIGIRSATAKLVANNADTATLMAQACQ